MAFGFCIKNLGWWQGNGILVACEGKFSTLIGSDDTRALCDVIIKFIWTFYTQGSGANTCAQEPLVRLSQNLIDSLFAASLCCAT